MLAIFGIHNYIIGYMCDNWVFRTVLFKVNAFFTTYLAIALIDFFVLSAHICVGGYSKDQPPLLCLSIGYSLV
jgi:hypothetical protein